MVPAFSGHVKYLVDPRGKIWMTRNKKLLGARASLLGAPGIATRSKKLLGTRTLSGDMTCQSCNLEDYLLLAGVGQFRCGFWEIVFIVNSWVSFHLQYIS